MRLTPRIFKRADVGGFTKIGRALILLGVQVSHVNQDPVRHAVVNVGGVGVIIGGRREGAGKRIDPGARADAALVPIQSRDVRVGTARTEMGACCAPTGVTAAADEIFQGKKRMLHP